MRGPKTVNPANKTDAPAQAMNLSQRHNPEEPAQPHAMAETAGAGEVEEEEPAEAGSVNGAAGRQEEGRAGAGCVERGRGRSGVGGPALRGSNHAPKAAGAAGPGEGANLVPPGALCKALP